MKSGNLNFLEPSGPLQASNGTDLPYLPLSRAAVSRGKTPYTYDGEPSSAKRNGDRKQKQSERDRCALKRIASKIHKTTAAKVRTGLFVLKTMFPQKPYDESFTDPTFTVELQLLNLCLLKTTLEGEKDGVMIIKPGRLMTGIT